MTQQFRRKIRGFAVDQQTGTPVPNVVLLFEAKATDNNVTYTSPLGVLVTDGAGYASFDLTPYPESILPGTIQISALGNAGVQTNINTSLVSQPGLQIHFLLKVDSRSAPERARVTGLASIQNPDDIDREVSPHSFTVKSALTLGEGDCQTPIPSPFALKDFRFGRVVLRTDQSIPDDLPTNRELDPGADLTQQERNPLPLRIGEVLEFRQRWFPLGHSLGEIVYSLPLAPCESVNLAVIDWAREDTLRREDQVQSRESLFHDQRRDRTIEEAMGAALRESQIGFSLMGGSAHADSAGASATVLIYGIPVNLNAAASNLWSLGGAIAHTSGSRDITADSLQELHDRVRQATSIVRTLSSTVVIQATQQEQNVIQTRTITNYNHCHALTVQYYEVLRTFKVVTEFERRRRVLLVPYRLVRFDRSLALRFRTLLEKVLLDGSLRECFTAISRLEYCSALYAPAPDAGANGASPPPEPTIVRYTLTLMTGEHPPAPITGVGDGGTWGGIWVKLLVTSGDEKQLLFKAVREHPVTGRPSAMGSEGIPGYEIEKNTTRVIDVISGDAIGLKLSDIQKVKVEWVESHGDDSWAFKGLGIQYQLSDGRTGIIKINGQSPYERDPYIVFFDDSGSNYLSWEGLASADPPEEPAKEDPVKPDRQPSAPLSKAHDECCAARLIAHLNGNIGYYNRAIWLLQDPVERRILLEELLFGTGLADLVDAMPVAVSGRYVAFPLDDPRLENVLLQPAVQEALGRLGLPQDLLNDIWNRAVEMDPREPKKPEPLVSYVSLPARGLFAEAQLGHCNSCEVREVTRFWKWDESPCQKAPEIQQITPGPKGQPPTVPQPASLPAAVVQVAQTPTAPDPTGLAAALKLLGTADLFKDMSGLDEVSKLLEKLSSGAVTSLQEAQKVAKEAQDKLAEEKTKAASGGGGVSVQQKQTPEERLENLQVARQAVEAASALGMSPADQRRVFENVLGTGPVPPAGTWAKIQSEDVRQWIRTADLISFRPPQSLLDDLTARGLAWQKIEDASGDLLNLDLYTLRISRLPNAPATGTQFTPAGFFDYVRKNFPSLLIRYPALPGPSLVPYEPADDTKWQSNNPLGAVMKFRIDPRPYAEEYPPFPLSGLTVPEYGLVMCAEFVTSQVTGDWHWNFVTIKGTGVVGYHPVSGTRQFGLWQAGQDFVFYIRAADRASTFLETAAGEVVFSGAEAYWNGFSANLLAFVKSNNGDAALWPPYSKRHDWETVRRYLFAGTTTI